MRQQDRRIACREEPAELLFVATSLPKIEDQPLTLLSWWMGSGVYFLGAMWGCWVHRRCIWFSTASR